MRNAHFFSKIVVGVFLLAFARDAMGAEDVDEICPGLVDQSSYASLKVTATKKTKAPRTQFEEAIEAEVYMNGVKVGKTPYQDCLPQGDYKIEIRAGNLIPFVRKIKVQSGQSYSVDGVFKAVITNEEQLELEKKRLKKEYKAKLKKWETDLEVWKAVNTPILTARKPYILYGTVILGGGVAFLVAGAILEANALDYNERAEKSHDLWLESDQSQEDDLLLEIEDYQRKRNIYNALGITSLAIGGAAAITSIVVFALMPRLPDKPERPKRQLFLTPKASLEITPIVNCDFFGGEINLSF